LSHFHVAAASDADDDDDSLHNPKARCKIAVATNAGWFAVCSNVFKQAKVVSCERIVDNEDDDDK